MKFSKVILIVSCFILALATIPLARLYCSDDLFYLYLAFKVWLFGIVPIIFIWLLRDKNGNKRL